MAEHPPVMFGITMRLLERWNSSKEAIMTERSVVRRTQEAVPCGDRTVSANPRKEKAFNEIDFGEKQSILVDAEKFFTRDYIHFFEKR